MKTVVFVDVQKDFIDGALKNDKAIEVTPKIVEFAKECVKNGYKLYATRDTHEQTIYGIEQPTGKILEVTKQPGCKADKIEKLLRGYLTTLEGENLPIEHCIEGTDGWMIDNRLMEVLDGNCTFVNKNTFGSIDLAEIIQEDIKVCDDRCYFDDIILCGFCTDICVISNALLLRAKFPNTKITIMKDLCAGTTVENHEAALKIMQSCQIDAI